MIRQYQFKLTDFTLVCKKHAASHGRKASAAGLRAAEALESFHRCMVCSKPGYFSAKNQAIFLSQGGHSQGLQAYSFGCAATHISSEAAGHSLSRGHAPPFMGAQLPPAAAGPPPHTCTLEWPLTASHTEHLPAAPLPSPPGSSWQLLLCQA